MQKSLNFKTLCTLLQKSIDSKNLCTLLQKLKLFRDPYASRFFLNFGYFGL